MSYRALLISVAVLQAGPLARAEGLREEVKQKAAPRLTKAPKLLHFAEADYPQRARMQQIEGAVELSILIDAAGRVAEVEIISTPEPALGEAAVQAARKFVFSSAEVDGKPAPVRIQYTYRFALDSAFEPILPEWMQQPGATDTLVGEVREQGTRVPLSGVAVSISALGLEVRTDQRGRFSFGKVAPGFYGLRAVSAAHRQTTINVEVKAGERARVSFYLDPLVQDPYVTVVRGKRRETTVSRVSLRRRQLTTVPGTFGDPIRVVQNLPGLARPPYVGGALLIRGAAPEDSGAFLNGIEIPLLFHFLGGPSVLNPQFIDRIDYYPGNADVRYGRLIAGVVDVGARDTFTERWHGSFDVNVLDAGIFLDVPLSKRVSVAASLRRSYIDALLPPILEASHRKATTVVPVYYDYQSRLDVRLPGDDHAWLMAFGSDDQLDIASNEPDEDVAVDFGSRIAFHRIVGSWRHAFGDRTTSTLAPFGGFNRVALSSGSANAAVDSWFVGLREDLEHKLNQRVRLRFGTDTLVQYAVFDANIPVPAPYRNPATPVGGGANTFGNNLTTDVEPVHIDQVLGSVGLYADATIDVTDQLQAIVGLRNDIFFYYDNNVRLSVDPRLLLRYRIDDKTVIKGGAGLYSRAPDPGQSNAVTGNPHLVLMHAAQVSTGIERQLFRPEIKLDAQIYLNYRYDNVVSTDQVLVGSSGVRPLRYVNDGQGYSYGLELMLKHEVTQRFYGWIAYTLSWARQQLEPGGDFTRFAFDQRHILTVLGSYRLGRGWEAGMRFRLVTGRPRTPIFDGVLDADGGFYRAVFGAEGSASEATFHQLDLRIEKTWLFDLWRLALYLDVQNVYNAENPEATLYDYRFRDSGPLRGLPFLPTLGVKGSF